MPPATRRARRTCRASAGSSSRTVCSSLVPVTVASPRSDATRLHRVRPKHCRARATGSGDGALHYPPDGGIKRALSAKMQPAPQNHRGPRGGGFDLHVVDESTHDGNASSPPFVIARRPPPASVEHHEEHGALFLTRGQHHIGAAVLDRVGHRLIDGKNEIIGFGRVDFRKPRAHGAAHPCQGTGVVRGDRQREARRHEQDANSTGGQPMRCTGAAGRRRAVVALRPGWRIASGLRMVLISPFTANSMRLYVPSVVPAVAPSETPTGGVVTPLAGHRPLPR